MKIAAERCRSLCDLNSDGKVDQVDLKVLTGRLRRVLDVNGDGSKIDVKDAKAALSIAALRTGALLASPLPAHAKGGSGDSSRSSGGGGGGGNSSSSISYSSRGSS